MKSAIIDKYHHMSPFTVTNFVYARCWNADIISEIPDHVLVFPQENDIISDVNYKNFQLGFLYLNTMINMSCSQKYQLPVSSEATNV